MTDLLPPYHKPMTSELDCDLANDRVAALEAELERVKTGVVQTHMYRLPVLAIEVETGEQGVHWIDGLSAAEVFAVLRDDVPAPVYESISGLHALVADLRAQAEESDPCTGCIHEPYQFEDEPLCYACDMGDNYTPRPTEGGDREG